MLLKSPSAPKNSRFLPKFDSKSNTRFLFRLDLQYNSERKSYFFKVAPYVQKHLDIIQNF